jgi:hypothetical protein
MAIAFVLEWNRDPGIVDAADFARRLHGLRALSVELLWGYRRARFPFARKAKTVVRCERVDAPIGRFRNGIVANWRANDQLVHLAEIAESGASVEPAP